MAPTRYDVFVSYASEDSAVAEALARELTKLGLNVWLDRIVLQVGDSLRRKIDDGLANSHYGVVLLSRHFLQKQWPQRELDGLVTREISEARTVVLPVWHGIGADEVRTYSFALADKVALRTSDGVPAVAEKIAGLFGSRPNTAVVPPQRSSNRKVGTLIRYGAGAAMVGVIISLALLPWDTRARGEVQSDSTSRGAAARPPNSAARLVSSRSEPEVQQIQQGEYALALPNALWDAVNAFLRPRPELRLASWAEASADGRAAMLRGVLQYPFALWRDLDRDGDLDVALVFVSDMRTNSYAWRDWQIVVFRGWPDGHFDGVPVTTDNASCFDGMIYVPDFNHVEFGCFEVAVGSFSWTGRGFFVETAMGD